MRFSVITITFNAEKYLFETLKSVSEQTFGDFEHLIWDGGSSDKTLQIASKFPNVKIFSGRDSGIADAMNKGCAFARGEFLLHLHADDRLAHPSVLEMVDICLKQHPAVNWLYGQIAIIGTRGDIKKTLPFVPFDAKKLRKYNIISHPATFVSRALFDRVGGFNTSLRYCMDYDLWLKLAQFESAFAMPAVLAHFREHEGSLSSREQMAVADEAYHVRNFYVRSFLERVRSYRTWKKRKRLRLNAF